MSLAETTSTDLLSLEVPLDAAHILTVRLFAGGAAGPLQLGVEAADVLRLTLSEICSEAIERRRGGRLVIEILADAGSIRVLVVATGARGEKIHTDPTGDGKFRRTLIEALVPDAKFVEEPDRWTAAFTLRPH